MTNGVQRGLTDFGETQVMDGANSHAIESAASILRRGGLVAFPTETVYGLGADGLNVKAVAKIYEAKGRPPTNPLILHVADIESARHLVIDWPGTAEKLAKKYWPGPLTIVLPASSVVPDIVRAGNPTVALRCPDHPIAIKLLRAFGGPLAAPSANRSTETSPTKPEHVIKSLGGCIDLILDGGRTASGIESTIINLTETPPRLLRPGPICPSELEAIFGHLLRFEGAIGGDLTQIAPGMTQRHYAPKACLTVHGLSELICLQKEIQRFSNKKSVIVIFGDVPEISWTCDFRQLPSDPRGASARLYALLHDLDAQGYQRILFQEPPLSGEWLAMRDRLARAASKG